MEAGLELISDLSVEAGLGRFKYQLGKSTGNCFNQHGEYCAPYRCPCRHAYKCTARAQLRVYCPGPGDIPAPGGEDEDRIGYGNEAGVQWVCAVGVCSERVQ